MKKIKKSKKSKKDWRKNIDLGVTDETEALENAHAIGRLERADNDDIFAVDRGADSKSTDARRIKKRDRVLIERDPSIPILSVKRPRTKGMTMTKTEIEGEKKKKKRVASVMETKRVSHMALASSGQALAKGGQNQDKKKGKEAVYDIWGGNGAEDEASGKRKRKRRMGIQPKPKYTEAQPSVVPAAPGASYRPSYTAHQALLKQEVEREEAELAKKAMEMSIQVVGNDDDAVIDLDYGFASDSDSDDSDGSENDGDEYVMKKTERLTEKQRKRREKHKAAVKEAKRKKELRSQIAAKAKALAQAKAKGKGKKSSSASAERQRKKEEKEKRLPRLGKHAYQEPPEPVLLTDELPSSLRQLDPQGSVLKDRFDSMQRRGVIEPRKHTRMKKKFGRTKGGRQKFLQRAFVDL